VLSQTDLYLLNPELDINPILSATSSAFQLQFNLSTGLTTGFNAEARDRDLPFTAKDEPATLPRVSELIVVTELSPWCTIIKNPQGVTLNDVCQAIWKEYVTLFGLVDGRADILRSQIHRKLRYRQGV
jgi:hypothetical protein